MKKRNLFAEIAEGFATLANERAGKQTLRTHKVEVQPLSEVTAAELVACCASACIFRARYLPAT
jgi:putative transcriptional regulator